MGVNQRSVDRLNEILPVLTACAPGKGIGLIHPVGTHLTFLNSLPNAD
jgi:hypothetical protein